VTEARRKQSATSFVPKKMREKTYKCPIVGCTKVLSFCFLYCFVHVC
jgi:hypothetical protein